jgi:hypothetical protein
VQLGIYQSLVVRSYCGLKEPPPERASVIPPGSKRLRVVGNDLINLLHRQSSDCGRHARSHAKKKVCRPGHRAPYTSCFDENLTKKRRSHLPGKERALHRWRHTFASRVPRAIPPIGLVEIQAHKQDRASCGAFQDSRIRAGSKLKKGFRRVAPRHRGHRVGDGRQLRNAALIQLLNGVKY